MALTIEDGTGIAGADCYADVAACSAYAVDFYGASLAGSPADKEAAIRRAFAFLSTLPWKGTRTHGRDQGGAWPRTGVTDSEGYAIADNVIPGEVIAAQHELARAEFQSPGAMTPTASRAKSVVSMEKVDVIQVQYDTDNMTGTIDDIRPTVTAAMDKIKGLLASDPASRGFIAMVV